MEYLSRQEEMVLLAVFRQKEEASLVQIRHFLNNNTEKRWSMSSVYIPLDRLKNTGFLTISIGDPTPTRGGRAKKYYHLTGNGIEALRKVRKVNSVLWDGIARLSEVNQ